MVETYFNLDFSVNKDQYINVSQYDDNSRTIKIALYNNGERIIIPSSYHVRIKMQKTDGTHILNDCVLEDNYAVFEITEQETAVYGNCLAELLFTNGDNEIIYTTNFILKVKKSVYPSSDVVSTSEYKSLENALIRADYDIEKMEEMINDKTILFVDDVVPSTSRENLVGVQGVDSNNKVPMGSLYAGTNNGLATLGNDGKVPESQLPSYVDDVIEGYAGNMTEVSAGSYTTDKFYSDSAKTHELTPESSKIYVDLIKSISFRWSGSIYISIGTSLTLGETSNTAYAGNKGKANADAISGIKNGQNLSSFADVETALANKSGGTFYGTSTGQAALQNKAVVVSANQHFELKVGCIVGVKFDANNTYNATTSAPVTMNVNNTGAKQIYYNNTPTPTGTQGVCFGTGDRYIYYMYDGTYWVWLNIGYEISYFAMSVSELTTGTATAPRVMDAQKTKAGIEALSTAYGTCPTEAATPEKIVTLVDSNWKLRIGATITVKFSNTNTATDPTLNVNNSGAKPIWYNSAILTKGWGAGNANVVTTFVYDGTYWAWTGHGIDTNTTYSAMSVNELTTGTATTLRTVRADYLKQGIEDIIDNNTHSIPNGGASNQVLAKNSNTDYDTKWASAAVIDDSSTTTDNVWSASKTNSEIITHLSHIGMVIHSTTLDTEAKVKAIYGQNTHWIQLSGYVLRGATSGVTPNNNAKDLGSDTHTITEAEMPSHYHSVSRQLLAESAGYHSHDIYSQGGGAVTYQGWVAQAINGYAPGQSIGSLGAGAHQHYISAHNTNSTGSGSAMSIIPNEKNVYIWERVG